MGTLTTAIFYRRIPRLLLDLQDDWTEGNVERHAQTSAVALSHLAINPSYASTVVLPAVVDFIERKGPQGVEAVLLAALSAASTHDPLGFQQSINRLELIGNDLSIPEPREDFCIPFLDLSMLREARPLRELVELARAKSRSRYPEGLLARLAPAPLGAETPRSLYNRYGAIGAGIVGDIVATQSADGARDRMFRGHYIARAGNNPLVPGFGFVLRGGTSSTDEYRVPASQSGAYSNPFWKAFGKCMALAAAPAGVAAVFTKTPKGAAAVGIGTVYGCVAAGIWQLWEEAEKLDRETERQRREMEEREGRTDDPDAQDDVTMPIPDGEIKGDPTIYEIMEAAARFASRDDPYVNPTTEQLGGGVVLIRFPEPGNIDPLWERVGGSVDEDELERWLDFLQKKLFLSLVNPDPND